MKQKYGYPVFLFKFNLAELLTNEGFSTLVDLVVKAGLADTVSNGGPFTVFAPTNEAFAALDPALVDSLVNNPEQLKSVILDHVVSGEVYSTDLSNNMMANAVSGGELRIKTVPSVKVNGANVVRADVKASNGVVHVIDKVILSENLAELLTNEGFSTLVDLVVKAGLAETVSNGGPFTVFAPTNEAFAALDPALVDSLVNNPELLKSVILDHVVSGEVYSTDLSNNMVANGVNGGQLRIKTVPSVKVNGANVVRADVKASNGVVHVIDKVILSENLAELLTNEGFSTLVDLVVKAGLAETVSTGGPFTVFAPTNEAFAALDPALVDSLVNNPEQLKSVILDHVVSGEVYSTDLSNNMVANGVNGGQLRIKTVPGVKVNGANVVRADVKASNGVVHVIDKVILSENLAELLTNEGFSTLVDLVVKAGLAETVSTGGPFTVFAPTNEAFAALDPALVNSLVNDPEQLKSVILLHVVPGEVYSTDLSNNMVVDAANGGKLTINTVPSVKINDANVVRADIKASNGVVHVIDQVILPGSEAPGNLAELLTAEGFSTLVDLVVKAGLAETLSNGGPFTVFAPTNEAFAALDPDLVQSLVNNPEQLKSVILYHVVSGEVYSSALSNNLLADSVAGSKLRVNIYQKQNMQIVAVNGAKVLRADVKASNGVVHVIDKVILAPGGDIVGVLSGDARFSTLVSAVAQAGLVDTLKSAGPFTVFAPTNDAFNKVPSATLNKILNNPETLQATLLRHVISGEVVYQSGACFTDYTTASNKLLRTGTYKGGRMVVGTNYGRANVIDFDMSATNGVIHAIDMVI
ncbi:unnamed protein product, partial [Meganyctiphanes norvegica]